MKSLRTPPRRAGLLAALAAVLMTAAACSSGHTGTIGPRLLSNLPDTPVVFVHGYNPATCPGNDVTKAIWGGAYLELRDSGWRGPLLPVSYYGCDRDGVDITGFGPSAPTGVTPTITAGVPRVQYNQNASIDVLAHDLAWFVYNTFTHEGTPVDLVGVSMGGLIIRDLLYRVERNDPRFPPKLVVTHAVTFSTPYAGYGGSGSSSICPLETVECQEFAVGSPLIKELNSTGKPPEGDGGTTWSVAGSSAGCDLVPATSSLALAGARRIDYLKPCYAHTAYLWDADPTSTASARITEPDGSTSTTEAAPHALRWLVTALADK